MTEEWLNLLCQRASRFDFLGCGIEDSRWLLAEVTRLRALPDNLPSGSGEAMTDSDIRLVESRTRCLSHLLDAESSLRGVFVELGYAGFTDRFPVEGLEIGDELDAIQCRLREIRKLVWEDKERIVHGR